MRKKEGVAEVPTIVRGCKAVEQEITSDMVKIRAFKLPTSVLWCKAEFG